MRSTLHAQHQYVYSPYCSLLISSGADEENLFINQGASLVGDHFADSRDLKYDSGMILLEEIRC